MTKRTPFRCIGVQEAASLRAAGDTLLTLDVRAADAYAAGHMDGARHIAFSNLGDIIGTTPRSKPVLIYCYHGHASQEFAQALSDFGFAEVYSLDGGYEAWKSFAQASAPAATPDAALSGWLESLGFPADGVNATVENRMTPLMKAAREGLADIIRQLLAAGAQLEARNADGNTALWLACVGNHLDVIDILVDAGINIDNLNDNGASSLMYASSAGKADVVERLLARGADPTPETPEGFSALDLASTRECLALLRYAKKPAKLDA